MDSNDRRRDDRIDREAAITVKPITFPVDAGEPVAVEMGDVSAGGVRINSPVSFGEGVTLEVTIKLPGWFEHTTTITRYREENKPLKAVGKVARCMALPQGGYEVGVEFTDIWADHWKAMRQYLAELKSGR